MGLERTGHEALREEEPGKPVGVGVSFNEPQTEHFNSQLEIFVPGCERLQGWIANRCPVRRHCAVLEADIHAIKIFTHKNKAVDGSLDVL